MFSFQEKGLHTSLLWHCVFIALVCTVNEWITPQNIYRDIRWASSAVCEANGWGGKGARDLLHFPFLHKGKKGKAYLSWGMIVCVTAGLAFSELLRSQSSVPHCWVCTALRREVEDNGRTKAELWLWQLLKAFQKVVGPMICWCSEANHAQASLVQHQPASSLSAIPTSIGNSLQFRMVWVSVRISCFSYPVM